MLPYFSRLRDGARTGARGRMRWCRLALGAGEIKGEQEPARGKQELSKQRELQTRAGYLQSEGGAGGEVRGGKLGRLAKRCALLPSAPARFGSRIHICRAHRQLCYSPAHSHEATHISLSYIYSRSSELARMKRGRIFAGKKKKTFPLSCRHRVPRSPAPSLTRIPPGAACSSRGEPASEDGEGSRCLHLPTKRLSSPGRRNPVCFSSAPSRLRAVSFPEEPLARRAPLLSSCLCLSSACFALGSVHPTSSGALAARRRVLLCPLLPLPLLPFSSPPAPPLLPCSLPPKFPRRLSRSPVLPARCCCSLSLAASPPL